MIKQAARQAVLRDVALCLENSGDGDVHLGGGGGRVVVIKALWHGHNVNNGAQAYKKHTGEHLFMIVVVRVQTRF